MDYWLVLPQELAHLRSKYQKPLTQSIQVLGLLVALEPSILPQLDLEELEPRVA